MKDRLNEGRSDYFNLDDGHDIPWMAADKRVSSARAGHHSGTMQEEQQSANWEGQTGRDVGDMPLRQVGSMAKNGYGADLGMNATNSLGKIDAESDSRDPLLEPRPGGVKVRF